jgi:hypothetical protein
MNNSFSINTSILNKYYEIGKPTRQMSGRVCCQNCGANCYAYTYSQATRICHKYGLKNNDNPQINLNAISVQRNYDIDFSSVSGYPI